MSMLAFFPWISLKEETPIGEFRLVPYRRGEAPFTQGGKEQAIVDNVLRPYLTAGECAPVASAALLAFNGRQLITEYTEEERDALFLASEVIAFSGMAEREYFGSSYVNREGFAFVIQAFREDATEGVAISSRRRDGRSLNYQDSESYRVHQPYHTAIRNPAHLNAPLAKALFNARGQNFWPGLSDAIFWFNMANSDSPTIQEQAEAVMIVGALESLTDQRADEKKLVMGIRSLFTPSIPKTASECPRLKTVQDKKDGVIGAWLRDFVRSRHQFAHGHRDARNSPKWTLREHLLLGSFFFPLLVKSFLQKKGLYSLSEKDKAWINAFEPLLCTNPFARPYKKDWTWNAVMGKARWGFPMGIAVKHAMEFANRERKRISPGDALD